MGNKVRYKLNIIQEMKKSIHHRGPDGEGEVSFDNCILGHVRLSIIDIKGGKQPMMSSELSRSVTYNGEIYNFKELKKKLKYPFLTQSDTEVLLALYEKYNETFVNDLSGMFAFAIWDESKQKLFCARDRFGEKPFYYAIGINGEFVFASEIKAIVASGLVNLEIDQNSLSHYLQKLYVPVNKTIYKNIYNLPAAHQLVFELNQITISRYWSLPKEKHISLGDAVDEFTRLFELSVERQLIADVETGAFLSGGLDSSSIVAVASKYKKKLKTFAYGFDGNQSELPYAKAVAQLYKTEHYEFVDHQYDIASLLIDMQSIYDEPFADSSNIPTYVISKHARDNVKVVLSGDGGDELLAGYSFWYQALNQMQKINDTNLAKYFIAKLIIGLTNKYSKALKLTALKNYTLGATYRKNYVSIADAKRNQNIYFSHTELKKLGLDYDCIEQLELAQNGTVNDALRIDLTDYMPGDILVKVDRASMANGLEVRAPFLDSDFASFCISLPSALKIDSASDKIILRKAFEHKWPEVVINRNKQGFGAPVNQWLKQSRMKELKKEFLNQKTNKLYSFIEFEKVQHYFDEDSYKTWILLVASIWMETHTFSR